MNVFNELFTTSKIEFPEQQQLIEGWTNFLENFKKQIKYLGNFLIDITNSLDQYGKLMVKSGRSLILNLSKLSTQNSKNLSDCLKNCGNFSEMLGGVYSRSSLTMSSTINQKIIKISNTISEIKKSIIDESSHTMKELSQAKISHLKIKVKYEKAKKEHEFELSSAKKIKSDPANSYQPSVIQRAKEKTKASKKEVSTILKNLNEHVDIIYQKNDELETLLYNLHSNTLTFEKDAILTLNEILQSMMLMLRSIIVLRKEQASLKQEQLNGLANITLDMVGGKENESGTNTLEYLSYKLDSRVISCEDRLKVLKCFKNYISEAISSEEALSKSLDKSIKSLLIPEYFEVKQFTKCSWDKFSFTILELATIHSEQAKELNKKALEPMASLLNYQGNLGKNLQTIVQKIMKDHALTHEECLKEFEKLKRTSEDTQFQKKTLEIKDKMLFSNQNTEHLVLSSLAESSNQEAGYLQSVKQCLINIYNLEDSLNSSLFSIIEGSYKFLLDVKLAEDFKDTKVYVRKSLPAVASFSQISHTSESVEAEDEPDALTDDNLLQKFGLKSKTSIIESFSCALSQKLLLHGRMYLTNTHICFHSYFNSTTIFGRETLISIPLSDIVGIEKRTSALIFDNALYIVTSTSNFMFKSFLYREQAYVTLENLLKITIPVSKTQYITCEFIIENRQYRKDIQKVLISHKSDSLSSSMVSLNILKTNIIDPPLPLSLSVQLVYFHYFSDESSEFLKKYLEAQGNTEIDIGKWNAPAPSYYIGSAGDAWTSSSTRIITYTRPVKERVPMMPKTCSCAETQTIYFLSKQEFIIDCSIKVSGVPLSDCFIAYMRWKVTGEDESSIEVRYGVEFLKSTMFRNKIENTGISETKTTINSVWIEMAKRKLQEIKGNPVPEIFNLPVVVPDEKIEYNKYFVWAVLLLIFTYLWIKINSLETQLEDLKKALKILTENNKK
jgi:VAD1 Analog of StAR-related lipid transfer domain/GRAM domain